MSSNSFSGTFLITGFGRSGTMFLSSLLNSSPTWTVEHEPVGLSENFAGAASRFSSRTRYGEINSLLRHWLPDLPADRKAVILRSPWDLAVSVYNRHPKQITTRLTGVWKLLDAYVEASYQVFRFEDFTRDLQSIMKIATWAGIDDLQVEENDFQVPLNATRHRRVRRYQDIPLVVRREIDPGIAWFGHRHYPHVAQQEPRATET